MESFTANFISRVRDTADTLTHARADLTLLRTYGLVLLAGGLWSLGGTIVREIEVADEWQLLFYRSVTLTATLFAFLAARSRRRVVRTFQAAGAAGLAAVAPPPVAGPVITC